MRISIVGHFKEDLDEGVRFVGRHLAHQLQLLSHEVQTLDISSPIDSARSLRRFRPQIAHFVISPTVLGLVMSKMLSTLIPDANTVISAVHPSIPHLRGLRILKPDLVLTQAEDSERRFTSLGFRTKFLPNGVDLSKFRPLNPEARMTLRKDFGIPANEYVVLHLASMRKERNLSVFTRIQQIEGIQVVIVGREGERSDTVVRRDLVNSGCIILEKHFPEIENMYNLADCYVFPTRDRKACIETPLSVLEAIACGLPVVTTRFGALPRIISEMPGVLFADDEPDMLHKIEMMRSAEKRPTSEEVQIVSWTEIAKRLTAIYQDIATSKTT
jgi:glycosyltransferase involved in cell wall biosynthesis